MSDNPPPFRPPPTTLHLSLTDPASSFSASQQYSSSNVPSGRMAALTAMSSVPNLSNFPNTARPFISMSANSLFPDVADPIVSPITPVPSVSASGITSFRHDSLSTLPANQHDALTVAQYPPVVNMSRPMYLPTQTTVTTLRPDSDQYQGESQRFQQYDSCAQSEQQHIIRDSAADHRQSYHQSYGIVRQAGKPNTAAIDASQQPNFGQHASRTQGWPPQQETAAMIATKYADIWALPRFSVHARKWLFPGRNGVDAEFRIEAFRNIPCAGVVAMYACFEPNCAALASEPATILQRSATVFQAVSAPVDGVSFGYFVTETWIPGTSNVKRYSGRFAHSKEIQYLIKVSTCDGSPVLRIEHNVRVSRETFLRDLVHAYPASMRRDAGPDGNPEDKFSNSQVFSSGVESNSLSLTMFDGIPESLVLRARSVSLYRVRERANPATPTSSASKEDFGHSAFGIYDYCALPAPEISRGGSRQPPPPILSHIWGFPVHLSTCQRPSYIITDMEGDVKAKLHSFLYQVVLRETAILPSKSLAKASAEGNNVTAPSIDPSREQNNAEQITWFPQVFGSNSGVTATNSVGITRPAPVSLASGTQRVPIEQIASRARPLSAVTAEGSVVSSQGRGLGRIIDTELSARVQTNMFTTVFDSTLFCGSPLTAQGQAFENRGTRSSSHQAVLSYPNQNAGANAEKIFSQAPQSHLQQQSSLAKSCNTIRAPADYTAHQQPVSASFGSGSIPIVPQRFLQQAEVVSPASGSDFSKTGEPAISVSSGPGGASASSIGSGVRRGGRGGRRGTPPSPSDVVMRNRISAQKSNEKRRRRIEASKKELATLKAVRLPQLQVTEMVLKAENEQVRRALAVKYGDSLSSIESMF